MKQLCITLVFLLSTTAAWADLNIKCSGLRSKFAPSNEIIVVKEVESQEYDQWTAEVRDGKLIVYWFNCDGGGELSFNLESVKKDSPQTTSYQENFWGEDSSTPVTCTVL